MIRRLEGYLGKLSGLPSEVNHITFASFAETSRRLTNQILSLARYSLFRFLLLLLLVLSFLYYLA